jgi:hypothetical protein
MRRLRIPLVLAAVSGAAILLPTFAGSAQQGPVKPHVEDVPLTPQSQPVQQGWQKEARPTNLVGVQWTGDANAHFAVETRDHAGHWSKAADVQKTDYGPDAGSPETASVAAHGNVTEPVWLGDDDTKVRVRLDNGSAQDVTLKEVDALPSKPGTVQQAMVVGRGVGWALLAATGIGLVVRRRRILTLLAAGALVVGAGCSPLKKGPPGGSTPIPGGIISRDAWGAAPPDGCQGLDQWVGFAVVHHTVNSNFYSPGQSASMVRGIQAYHQSTGYCDIAYNFLIDRYGQVFEGRFGGIDKPVHGAHTLNFNSNSTGIAVIGNFQIDAPPPVVQGELVDLIAWKFRIHHTNPEPWNSIIGHRDVYPTECPGVYLYSQLDAIRGGVRARVPYNLPPIGNFEYAARNGNSVQVSGWALDPDNSTSINVLVQVDGVNWVTVPANLSRPDVAAAYPYYYDLHGFDTTFNVGPGPHTIRVIALNGVAGGYDVSLGDRAV